MTEYQRGYIDGLKGRKDLQPGSIKRAAKIQDLVLDHFETTFDAISKKSRTGPLIYMRHTLTYILYKHTSLGCKLIGSMLNQDHTTVLHAISAMKDRIETDYDVRDEIDILTQKIQELYAIPTTNA